jgi:hypothetical protein
MNGRYQVAGLDVLELTQKSPDFWLREPDFFAIFNLPGPEITSRILDIEPQVNKTLSLYRPEDGKQVAEDLKHAYLAKMFIAWLKGEPEEIKANITLAAQAVPLDAPVQQLYRRVTGEATKMEFTLTPIKPLE